MKMFLYAFYRRYVLLLRIIALFFMGLLVAVLVALSQVNLETLRGNILSVMRDVTNLPVEIDGDMSWKFSLHPHIEFNNVRIPNASWAKNKNLFSAEKIDVRLDLLSLFKTKPVIRYIRIHDARVNLEKNSHGANSIVFNDVNENIPNDEPGGGKRSHEKYPVSPLPFSGLEIDNIVANIYDKKYSLASFNIRNYMRHENVEYSGWVRPYQTNFPFVIKFAEYDTEKNIYPVQVAFATSGDALIAEFNLDGDNKLPNDFVVHGEIPNLKKSGDWFKLNLVSLPKMRIDAAFRIDNKKITFKKSELSMGGSSISFSGSYDWSKNVPVLNAKVLSGDVNLYKSFPDWFGGGKEWIHPNRDLNCFHDMPLFGDVLYGMDVNVDINLKRFIVYRSLNLSDAQFKLKVKNHKLRADAKIGIASGIIKAVVLADINEDGVYTAQAAAVGQHIYVGDILKEIYIKNIVSGLPLDVNLYVRATGKNMSEIMQTMTGPVIAYSVDKGFAHADLVEYMYGGDFLTSLRHNVEDLFTGNKRDMIQIDGAVANVKLRNGLIETQNGVAVETHVINLRLAGTLDLGRENIQLSLASVPVRGLKLSLSGNLVNSMQISGNLAEPDFKISGAAIAGKVGSAVGLGLLLSPLTGGLSIAGGLVAGLLAGDLIEGWLADDEPYNTALQKGAPIRRDDPDWFRKPVEVLSQSLFENAE
jgi:hypothetical protein